MSALAEFYLRRLKSLHERFTMPWRYDRLAAQLARRKTLLRKE
jgi:hypothetical protein